MNSQVLSKLQQSGAVATHSVSILVQLLSDLRRITCNPVLNLWELEALMWVEDILIFYLGTYGEEGKVWRRIGYSSRESISANVNQSEVVVIDGIVKRE